MHYGLNEVILWFGTETIKYFIGNLAIIFIINLKISKN
jgi:hypothetical protein